MRSDPQRRADGEQSGDIGKELVPIQSVDGPGTRIAQPHRQHIEIQTVDEQKVEMQLQRLSPLRHAERSTVAGGVNQYPTDDDNQSKRGDQKVEQHRRQGAGAEVARDFARRRKQKVGEAFGSEQIGHDHDEQNREHARGNFPGSDRAEAIQSQYRLGRSGPTEKEKYCRALRITEWNIQNAMSRQDDDQRQNKRGSKAGEPSQIRKLYAFHRRVVAWLSRFLARRMNHLAAVQEDRTFEQTVRDQMKDRQAVCA